MNDPAAALESYRKYLEQGGQRITPERRQQVTDEMTALGRRVATLTVSADVVGAEVWVDDARAGITPLRAPLVVNAGGHRISLRHADYPPQVELVNLAGGASDRIEFKLGSSTPEPPRAPDATAQDPSGAPGNALAPATLEPTDRGVARLDSPPPQSNWWRDHAWIGWVVTGTLAAGGTATGLWAISSNSRLSGQRADATTGGATRADLEWSAWRVRTLATVTDALWIATAVSGGISLWLTLGPDETERVPKTSEATPLRVRVGASGVSLEGRF
jgi:PEGA domain